MNTQAELRQALVAAVQRLDALGMNRGSTGNVSARCDNDGEGGMLITPTGMAPTGCVQATWCGWVGTAACRANGNRLPNGTSIRRPTRRGRI